MNKKFSRLVASLLVFCLITDPAIASGPRVLPNPAPQNTLFKQEALASALTQWRISLQPTITEKIFSLAGNFLTLTILPSVVDLKMGAPQSKIVVADKLDAKALGAPVDDISELKPEEKLAALVRLNPRMVLVRSETEIKDPTLIEQLTNLTDIIRGGHGTDNLNDEELRKRNVNIHKTGGSEKAVSGLILRMIARAVQGETHYETDQAPPSFFSLTDEWAPALEDKIKKKSPEEQMRLRALAAQMLTNIGTPTLESLRGMTIGIIGFGGIAQQLAETAANELGMKVIVYSTSLPQNPEAATRLGYRVAASINELGRDADFVVPLTGLNEKGPKMNVGMLGEEFFNVLRQKKTPTVVVNVDRPGLVVEPAIMRFIQEYPGSQYLMDDTPKEATLKKLILYTPHIGASTPSGKKSVMARTAQVFKSVLERWNAAAPANDAPIPTLTPDERKAQISQVFEPLQNIISKFLTDHGIIFRSQVPIFTEQQRQLLKQLTPLVEEWYNKNRERIEKVAELVGQPEGAEAYHRNTIYIDALERFGIWLHRFAAGQGTPIHRHGNALQGYKSAITLTLGDDFVEERYQERSKQKQNGHEWVTLDDLGPAKLKRGEIGHITVEDGTPHRLTNAGTKTAGVIEIYLGLFDQIDRLIPRASNHNLYLADRVSTSEMPYGLLNVAKMNDWYPMQGYAVQKRLEDFLQKPHSLVYVVDEQAQEWVLPTRDALTRFKASPNQWTLYSEPGKSRLLLAVEPVAGPSAANLTPNTELRESDLRDILSPDKTVADQARLHFETMGYQAITVKEEDDISSAEDRVIEFVHSQNVHLIGDPNADVDYILGFMIGRELAINFLTHAGAPGVLLMRRVKNPDGRSAFEIVAWDEGTGISTDEFNKVRGNINESELLKTCGRGLHLTMLFASRYGHGSVMLETLLDHVGQWIRFSDPARTGVIGITGRGKSPITVGTRITAQFFLNDDFPAPPAAMYQGSHAAYEFDRYRAMRRQAITESNPGRQWYAEMRMRHAVIDLSPINDMELFNALLKQMVTDCVHQMIESPLAFSLWDFRLLPWMISTGEQFARTHARSHKDRGAKVLIRREWVDYVPVRHESIFRQDAFDVISDLMNVVQSHTIDAIRQLYETILALEISRTITKEDIEKIIADILPMARQAGVDKFREINTARYDGLLSLPVDMASDPRRTVHPHFNIAGLPLAGPAEHANSANWNDVSTWINAVTSRDGTKLAAAVNGKNSLFISPEDVGYIVEYNRDPKTGALSHGRILKTNETMPSILRDGQWERLGTNLLYTSDNRLTFTAVAMFAGWAEIAHTEMTRDDFKSFYRIYQVNKTTGRAVVTNEIVGYADPYRHDEWRPQLSPDGTRALLPILLWHKKEQHNSKAFLIETTFDLEQGIWDKNREWTVFEEGQDIPGSWHQPLRLTKGAAQYSYAKDGRSILLAQDGRFYQITTADPSGRFNQKLLKGKLLSATTAAPPAGTAGPMLPKTQTPNEKHKTLIPRVSAKYMDEVGGDPLFGTEHKHYHEKKSEPTATTPPDVRLVQYEPTRLVWNEFGPTEAQQHLIQEWAKANRSVIVEFVANHGSTQGKLVEVSFKPGNPFPSGKLTLIQDPDNKRMTIDKNEVESVRFDLSSDAPTTAHVDLFSDEPSNKFASIEQATQQIMHSADLQGLPIVVRPFRIYRGMGEYSGIDIIVGNPLDNESQVVFSVYEAILSSWRGYIIYIQTPGASYHGMKFQSKKESELVGKLVNQALAFARSDIKRLKSFVDTNPSIAAPPVGTVTRLSLGPISWAARFYAYLINEKVPLDEVQLIWAPRVETLIFQVLFVAVPMISVPIISRLFYSELTPKTVLISLLVGLVTTCWSGELYISAYFHEYIYRGANDFTERATSTDKEILNRHVNYENLFMVASVFIAQSVAWGHYLFSSSLDWLVSATLIGASVGAAGALFYHQWATLRARQTGEVVGTVTDPKGSPKPAHEMTYSGERLRELREELALTQADIGRRLGISNHAVGLIENEKHPFSEEYAKKIAKWLSVPLDRLRARNRLNEAA